MDDICACVEFNPEQAKDGKMVPFCGNAFVPQFLPDLSYQEQYAGYHNIDGNKVYCKTIDFGTLGAAGSYTRPHNIENFKDAIAVSIKRINPSAAAAVFGNVSDTSQSCAFSVSRTGINVNHTSVYTGHPVLITIHYTCTDR